MADVLDCAPCFTGRPTIIPGAGSILPQEPLRRSRKFAGGTFFRSKLTVPGNADFQGDLCNDISLEVILTGNSGGNDNFDLVVYIANVNTITADTITSTADDNTITADSDDVDVEVERYSVTQSETCNIFEPSNTIADLRTQTATSLYISMPARGSDAQDSGIDNDCLSAFIKSNMAGGTGPGAAQLPTIRTGPDRSIVFVTSTENASGTPTTSKTLIQWDFDNLQFIAYILDADCALPENRCP